jgi:chitin deacetylase
VALEELNSLSKHEFVAQLGGVFEHSPWIAERAWHKRPFRSLEALHSTMMDVIRNEARERQVALVRAHPELAGSEALTVDSTSEQGRLGFNALSSKESEAMSDTNRRYREKFGFPCIVALRLHANRASVMSEMQRRIGNDADTELANALVQIGHITRGRLEKLLNG